MYYIVGLGNPGEEYEISRHNTGRIVVGAFLKKFCDIKKTAEMDFDKKLKALTTDGEIGKEKFSAIFPETFMNKSGLSLKPIAAKIVNKKKMAEKLIVVHDDIDLPLGKFKISFGKGSAGHKGVESIIKNIKTKNFIRIRVGVSQSTPSGKLKKPKGEKILDFIIGNFKPKETLVLKKTSKKIVSALEAILTQGLQKARYNTK